MQDPIVFSLDLGTTSVGWAVTTRQSIISSGVRIFPEGMDRTKGEKSLNQERSLARGIRRQGYRRVRRKRRVEHALQEAGLLPDDPNLRDALYNHPSHNPYELRARALDEKLEPFQLGRALYHLAQRRGYLSNRKTGTDEDGAVKAGTTQLSQCIESTNSRTLGEYFYLHCREDKIRGRYTSRQMFIDEFNQIWQAQSAFHTQLNAAMQQRIYQAIFHQRPLKIQSWLLGKCELEPERKRAYAATLAAQEFRIWQSINNSKVQLQAGEVVELSPAQKQQLFDLLSVKKSISWKTIKTKLGFLESDVFNLENSRASGMLGNATAAGICKVLGKSWLQLSEQQQEKLVFDLINIEEEPALIRRLTRFWNVTYEQALALNTASLAFPQGTMSLSHKAIRQLLPHLKKGTPYHQAVVDAGYQPQLSQEQVLPQLPLFSKNLRNPMVERALFQVRRVVNSLIQHYGKPDIIRIELARDLRNNAKRRQQIQKQQNKLEKLNKEADQFFADNPHLGVLSPRRSDRIKYRLWQECRYVCPFSGDSISAEQLFKTGEVQVEHIIPYTRSLDDSFSNKTLCFARLNQEKDNLTPFERWGKTPRYEAILQNIKVLPRQKRERFNKNTDKFIDDFVSQQLNETGYIARETKDYLAQLGCRIEPVKGGVTANLRHAWGLNGLLNASGDNAASSLKNRDDHRHHAIDAITLAFATRKAVKLISDSAQRSANGQYRLANYPLPYPEFRDDAKKATKAIVISHKRSHKIKGALHEDTLYGVAEKNEQGKVTKVVIRKPLIQLDAKQLTQIRDEKLRAMAMAHFNRAGSIQKAFGDEENPFGFQTKKGQFVPVRSVRITDSRSVVPVGKGKRQRYVKTGSNHHVAIYQKTKPNGKPYWEGDVVSTLDARIRKKEQQRLVRQSDDAGNPLVMTLHINDMLEMNDGQGREVFRVQKLSAGKITLRHHCDARTAAGKHQGEITKSADKLRQANAVIIYPNVLGRYNHDQTDH